MLPLATVGIGFGIGYLAAVSRTKEIRHIGTAASLACAALANLPWRPDSSACLCQAIELSYKRVGIFGLEMIKEARRYTTTPGFAVQVSVVYSEEPVPMLWLPEKNRYWGPLLGFGARSIKLLHRSASYQCDSGIADAAYSDRRSWTYRCRSPLAQKLRQVRIDTGRPPDSCLAACTGRARPGDWRHPLAGTASRINGPQRASSRA